MNRKILTVLFAFVLSVSVALPGIAQKSKHAKRVGASLHQTGSPWLIKWTKGEVSLSEFEAAYRRMNEKDPYATTLDSLKDFLNVYADYRLKLEDAKAEGLDKDPKIQTEINGYRQMLAGPYILEKELTDPAIQQLFERRKYELHAAHFLSAVKNWNNPADTLRAFQKAERALALLNDGMPMSYIVMNGTNRAIAAGASGMLTEKHLYDLAHDSTVLKELGDGSDDKASAKNGGDLGWFTGGMTVRQFEDAAYSLQPGTYTKYPVKTRFGYHIIYLIDKQPRSGGIHVEHILVSVPKFDNIDTSAQYHKIDSLRKAIMAGASFEQVAKESSDDKYTGIRGGDMDTINREERRTEINFDRAAYALKDGEISPIVRTSFGYHIIKRINGVPPKSFEQEKEAMKQLYKKYYFEEDKQAKIAQLRSQYGLKIDSATINYFEQRVDSSKTSIDSNWTKKILASDRAMPVFTMGGMTWTLGSLVDSLNAQPGSPLARNAIYDMTNRFADDEALSIAARNISAKYPEFEKIMDDYRNGIILFDLENKRVWSKVVPDSIAEKKFYEANKVRYLWPERVDISEIFVSSDSLAKALYKRVINGENFDSLAKRYTERPGFKDKAGHWGILQKDDNELARRAFDFVPEEVKEPFSYQGGYSILRLNRKDPIHQKTFEEARQEVASQYQDERANELRLNWVESLRKKYKRQLNEQLLVSEYNMHHAPEHSTLVH